MVEVIVMRSTETVIGAAFFFCWWLAAPPPRRRASFRSPQNVAWCAAGLAVLAYHTYV
ncbi:hypothetical protein GGI42DRAFT_316149 [Trichoderma sp. SZMC 28013]